MKTARRPVAALLTMAACLAAAGMAVAQPRPAPAAEAPVCEAHLTDLRSALATMSGYDQQALAAQKRGDKRQAGHYRSMSDHAYDMVKDSLSAYRRCMEEEMKAAKRQPPST